MNNLFEILYEDADFLVVNKPAGLVCHPTKTDAYSSLISRARLYLGSGMRPQLINRLDRETSGVTVLAKNETSARKLRQLWEQRLVSKEYCAIVHGHVELPHQVIAAPLGKDVSSAVAIKDCVRSDGAEAKTEVWLIRTFTKSGKRETGNETEAGNSVPPSRFSMLRVLPQTGRKHQIRIHLAHIGHPIVGDKLYGGDEDLYLALVENRLTGEQKSRLILPHHALHASEVRFQWNGGEIVFRAAPEPWFRDFCSASPAFPSVPFE